MPGKVPGQDFAKVGLLGLWILARPGMAFLDFRKGAFREQAGMRERAPGNGAC
ncbi:MAG: hypothetical protein KatS3mg076_0385 [Candidatus Binatia bacterium]|nr:MAG: hypothetical protein KatS3mg076_0385 [Candidatus Binatia bacterium]